MKGSVAKVTVVPSLGGAAIQLDIDADGIPDFIVTPGNSTSAALSLRILRRIVQERHLAQGITMSLLAKIDATQDLVLRHNNATAANQLNALLSQLNAQAGKQLPADFVSDVDDIVHAILLVLEGAPLSQER
jgi:hypothetical protein